MNAIGVEYTLQEAQKAIEHLHRTEPHVLEWKRGL